MDSDLLPNAAFKVLQCNALHDRTNKKKPHSEDGHVKRDPAVYALL